MRTERYTKVTKVVKSVLPFCLFTLLPLLCSCSSSDNEGQGQSEPAAQWTLRVVDGDMTALMDAGRTAGVFMQDTSGTFLAANALLTTGQNGSAYCQAELPASGAVTLFAYSPYRSDWSAAVSTPQLFEVETDQSRQAGNQESDLMIATAQTADGRAVVDFRHVLTRIVVHLTDHTGDYDMAHMAGIQLRSMATTAEVQLPDGIKQVISAPASDITPLTLDATVSRLTATAIVVPQSKQAGDDFIQVVLNGKTMPYSAPEGVATRMEGGKTYVYRLLLTKSGIVPDGSYVTNWDDDADITLQGE